MTDNSTYADDAANDAAADAKRKKAEADQQRREALVKRIRENPGEALKSEFSASFLALLEQGRLSVAVSTYQAGQVVLLRADNGKLNTHFCSFNRPMGIALKDNRLVVGTNNEVYEFRNTPAVAPKVEPVNRHDACYIPRSIHYTGNIDIHELDFAGDELWIVNTRFSCLCTLDLDHSFVPRWRPPWISGYAVEDRCHLNGLCVVDCKPRYVTALGQSDKAGGWRENKNAGGILYDIVRDKLLVKGLSMPHSPRWYRDKLWFLESGYGSLSYYDPGTGKTHRVAQMPGFTRGLDFIDRYALVGLSQVRETNTFEGIPITEDGSERRSGVWIIDIETGQSVGMLRFSDAVQEIFAVKILPGQVFPILLEPGHPLIGSSYVLPDAALRDVQLPPTQPDAAKAEADI
ncbi:MAG: TIGR03032 family protein [Pseudomonadota bacterium]